MSKIALWTARLVALTVAIVAWTEFASARAGVVTGNTDCPYGASAIWLDYSEQNINSPASKPTVREFASGFFTLDKSEAVVLADRWSREGFWLGPQDKIPPSAVVRVMVKQPFCQ